MHISTNFLKFLLFIISLQAPNVLAMKRLANSALESKILIKLKAAIPQSTLILKTEADNLWLEAQALAQDGYDIEEVNEKYEEAFSKYKIVHMKIDNFRLSLSEHYVLPDTGIVDLYYILKTLGDAYFEMGDFAPCVIQYERAYELYSNNKKFFLDVTENDIRGILYNKALANLSIWKENGSIIDINTLSPVAELLIDELLHKRINKQSGLYLNKILQELLSLRDLYRKNKLTFDSKDLKKMFRIFASILTKEQLLGYVTSSTEHCYEDLDSLLNSIQPRLTDKQRTKIEELSPQKKDRIRIIEELKNNINNLSEIDNPFDLRPSQIAAMKNFKEHLQTKGGNGYFVAATGFGKTRLFLSIILGAQSKAIVLEPSKALVDQTKQALEKLISTSKIKKSVGVFSDNQRKVGDITIMTYAALRCQLELSPQDRKINLDNYPLVILDEAHQLLTASSKIMIDYLSEDKLVIGCTATPKYNTKRPKGSLQSVSELFGQDNCFFEYPMAQGIKEKVLSPIHVCKVTTDLKPWPRNKRKKSSKENIQEVAEQQVAEKLNKVQFNSMIVEIYKNAIYPNTGKPIFKSQAIVFCAGIEHAQAIAETINKHLSEDNYFNENNITPAAYISGELSGKDQREILDYYREGRIAILCGADILTTGIDNPNMTVAFNLRPTRSLVLASQRLGRTIRTSEKMPNKIALIFEFDWLDGQISVQDLLDCQNQLGDIPVISIENSHYNQRSHTNLLDEEKILPSANWHLDWTQKTSEVSVTQPNSFCFEAPETIESMAYAQNLANPYQVSQNFHHNQRSTYAQNHINNYNFRAPNITNNQPLYGHQQNNINNYNFKAPNIINNQPPYGHQQNNINNHNFKAPNITNNQQPYGYEHNSQHQNSTNYQTHSAYEHAIEIPNANNIWPKDGYDNGHLETEEHLERFEALDALEDVPFWLETDFDI